MSDDSKGKTATRRWPITRRAVLASGSATGALAAFGFKFGALTPAIANEVKSAAPAEFLSRVPISFTVNGAATEIDLDPRTSLLDALRDGIGLTGTKKGCDHGQCGACTVHVDGRRVASCLTLAA